MTNLLLINFTKKQYTGLGKIGEVAIIGTLKNLIEKYNWIFTDHIEVMIQEKADRMFDFKKLEFVDDGIYLGTDENNKLWKYDNISLDILQ